MSIKHLVLIGGLTSYGVELIKALKDQGDIRITHLVRYFEDLQKGYLAQCGDGADDICLYNNLDDLAMELGTLIECNRIDAVLIFPPYYTLHPSVESMCIIKGNASLCTASEVQELADLDLPVGETPPTFRWLASILDILLAVQYEGPVEYLKLPDGFLHEETVDDEVSYTTYVDHSAEFYNALLQHGERYYSEGVYLYINEVGHIYDKALDEVVRETPAFFAHPPISANTLIEEFLQRVETWHRDVRGDSV